MASNKALATGRTFTLRELLDGDITLVIPDIQRDYCWGADSTTPGHFTDRVEPLVTAIVYLYRQRRPVSMGLLYGYTHKEQRHRVMIIDGQQRITTLFLLLGMLYRRTPSTWLRRLLISDYELLDDHEPRLLYQVRPEALYFMGDLVTRFFLDRDGRLSQLEQSPWYFSSYDSDPTVRSFIAAIRSIDTVLEQAAATEGWDFDDFTAFVADSLWIMYYDLGRRADAERMFVTINTTGEPLTPVQRIRALLYGGIDDKDSFVSRWEEMHRWAWEHRLDSGQTADGAMQRMLDLWQKYCALTQAEENASAPFHPDNFDKLYAFFTAYSALVEQVPQAQNCLPDSADDMLRLLPAVEYTMRWRQPATAIWMYFSNILRYQRALGSGADALDAITMVRRMPEPDIVSLLRLRSQPHRLMNEEQRAALEFLESNGHDRLRAQAIIRRAQAHPMLNGRTRKLLSWCIGRESDTPDIRRVEQYVDMIYQLWGTDINRNPGLDPVRRALLSMRHSGYPIMRRSATSLTLCWNDYEWQHLMQNSPGIIRQLIDRIGLDCKDDPKARLMRIVGRFNDPSYTYNFLVREPELLARCEHRSLLRPCATITGVHLDDGTTQWRIEQMPIDVDTQYWTPLRSYGAKCIYTDLRSANLAVDIHYVPDGRSPYRLEIFSRRDGERTDLMPLIAKLSRPVKFDRRSRRFVSYGSAAEVTALFREVERKAPVCLPPPIPEE